MKLSEILKGSEYSLVQFPEEIINEFENRIKETEIKGKTSYSTVCLVRGKEIKLTPEECVRQMFLLKLKQEYLYPFNRMELEREISFGREKKRADIVIFDKDRPTTEYIIVELKKPKLKDGKEQLKSYCNATGAPIGVWTNGEQISFWNRKDPNYFEDLPNIPRADQKLSDLFTKRWTIDDLKREDKLVKERKSLKDLILEMEDEVLANAGVDVFEEVFKLIFTKLYDEMESGRNKNRYLEFRYYGETEIELKNKVQKLFDDAKAKWNGVFSIDAKFMLSPSHFSVCLSSLQGVKLFNSNLEVVDEAFEYLINKSSKGEKGQYFTPRYVIDMCVKMLNPKAHESMIDTACGSCGFPVHTIFHVWRQLNPSESELYTAEQKTQEQIDYVNEKVFAIDFDEKAVRVARTLNLIAGDGQTNVMHLNTLDYDRWDEQYNDHNWNYRKGWDNIRKYLKNPKAQTIEIEETRNGKTYIREKQIFDCRDFQFDILMANPPFAGDIRETRILAKYDLAKKVLYERIKNVPKGVKVEIGEPTFDMAINNSAETIYQFADGTFRKVKLGQNDKMERDVLFIERNIDFLKPGGRMAIVLPQGKFNNSSDKYIREYIASRCRILAVVGLHGNVFKPHTGTKTSVMFLQKWTDDKGICPKVDDYPIFFATMQEPSKDNSGDKIYRSTIDENGDNVPLLDKHGHLIVKHDLFNHEGLTEDGIAEAFAEFAKKEHLSFF
ncbi:MAG: N-6 DNA methylase [Bacteroidales bacterium]|nr:N-6 DNA methylase [Bacteroidales bacterium]